MKPTKKQLETLRIFNSHDFCRVGGGCLFISYRPGGTGRDARVPEWQVIGINFKTEPKAPWYDYGAKSFVVSGRTDKELKLHEAKLWAGDKYHITSWVRDPFGGWQDERVYAQVVGKVNELGLSKPKITTERRIPS